MLHTGEVIVLALYLGLMVAGLWVMAGATMTRGQRFGWLLATMVSAGLASIGFLGWHMINKRRLGSAVVLLALAPAGLSAQTVASVGTEPISLKEVETLARSALVSLDRQRHEARHAALEALIDKSVLAQEARRFQITPMALREKLGAEVTPPTEEQVTASLRDHRLEDTEANRARARENLLRSARTDRIRSFVKEARQRYQIQTALEEPDGYRQAIALGDAPTAGSEAAPVTVVEFGDFECPYCATAASTLSRLKAQYGDHLRVAYKHFPLESIHPAARDFAQASWCAWQRGRFWPFHDRVFDALAEQKPLTVQAAWADTGLDTSQLQTCLTSAEAKAVVDAHVAEARRLGVDGTPTFFVNGVLVEQANRSSLREAIDRELARRAGRVPGRN
jgi:protein-disulfide isomerase